jgi:hypothetical protein
MIVRISKPRFHEEVAKWPAPFRCVSVASPRMMRRRRPTSSLRNHRLPLRQRIDRNPNYNQET